MIDHSGRGQVRSTLQMFGSVSFWCFWDNGYSALAALDDDGDRQLSGHQLRGLAVWHDVNGNAISEPGEVHGLSNLHYLQLDCTRVTDAGLVHLKALTDLKMLSLTHTQVTNDGVKELQRSLPDCQIMSPVP